MELWFWIIFASALAGGAVSAVLKQSVNVGLLLVLVISLGGIVGLVVSSQFPRGFHLSWPLVAGVGMLSSGVCSTMTIFLNRRRSVNGLDQHGKLGILVSVVLAAVSVALLISIATTGPAQLSNLSSIAIVVVLMFVAKYCRQKKGSNASHQSEVADESGNRMVKKSTDGLRR